jgi:hypothetical protein
MCDRNLSLKNKTKKSVFEMFFVDAKGNKLLYLLLEFFFSEKRIERDFGY